MLKYNCRFLIYRFLYSEVEKTEKAPVKFHDYDISDGKIYLTSAAVHPIQTRGQDRTHERTNDPVWYLYTLKQGINSKIGQTFGFGNSESTAKTGLGNIEGNMYNSNNADFDGPTFGLVESYDLARDTIQYGKYSENIADLFQCPYFYERNRKCHSMEK